MAGYLLQHENSGRGDCGYFVWDMPEGVREKMTEERKTARTERDNKRICKHGSDDETSGAELSLQITRS